MSESRGSAARRKTVFVLCFCFFGELGSQLKDHLGTAIWTLTQQSSMGSRASTEIGLTQVSFGDFDMDNGEEPTRPVVESSVPVDADESERTAKLRAEAEVRRKEQEDRAGALARERESRQEEMDRAIAMGLTHDDVAAPDSPGLVGKPAPGTPGAPSARSPLPSPRLSPVRSRSPRRAERASAGPASEELRQLTKALGDFQQGGSQRGQELVSQISTLIQNLEQRSVQDSTIASLVSGISYLISEQHRAANFNKQVLSGLQWEMCSSSRDRQATPVRRMIASCNEVLGRVADSSGKQLKAKMISMENAQFQAEEQ